MCVCSISEKKCVIFLDFVRECVFFRFCGLYMMLPLFYMFTDVLIVYLRCNRLASGG
jgi:hypothetical protein